MSQIMTAEQKRVSQALTTDTFIEAIIARASAPVAECKSSHGCLYAFQNRNQPKYLLIWASSFSHR